MTELLPRFLEILGVDGSHVERIDVDEPSVVTRLLGFEKRLGFRRIHGERVFCGAMSHRNAMEDGLPDLEAPIAATSLKGGRD